MKNMGTLLEMWVKTFHSLGPMGCGIHAALPPSIRGLLMEWVVVMQSLALVLGMCGVHDVHGGMWHVACMRFMGLMGYMG